MSRIEQEIAAERQRAEAQLAKLRDKAKRERQRIDRKVFEILKRDHPQQYAKLCDAASEEFESAKRKRASKASHNAVAESLGQPVARDPREVSQHDHSS